MVPLTYAQADPLRFVTVGHKVAPLAAVTVYEAQATFGIQAEFRKTHVVPI